VDGSETSTMSGSHILVERIDGIGSRHLSVLLVHVVGAGAGIVADPDAKVLDLFGALLVNLGLSITCMPHLNIPYLVDAHNLTVCLLDLAELGEEIPESGFGNDIVGCENTHAVELGSWVGLTWEVAADDLIFLDAT
jgi:hypothetical protein